MTEIRPTHSCFDDAIEFFELVDLDKADAFRIVHGLCYSVLGPYAHAWVEEGDRVWQGMPGRRWFAVDRVWFYAAYNVVERTVYTVLEAAKLNRDSGHYGPWDPRYRKHTGGGGIIGKFENVKVLAVLEKK
jgi:hypothetical protein